MDIVELNNKLVESSLNYARAQTQYYYPEIDIVLTSLFDPSQDILLDILDPNRIYQKDITEESKFYYIDYLAFKYYENYIYSQWLYVLNQITDPLEIPEYKNFALLNPLSLTDFIVTKSRITLDTFYTVYDEIPARALDNIPYINLTQFTITETNIFDTYGSYSRPSGVTDNDIIDFVHTLY